MTGFEIVDAAASTSAARRSRSGDSPFLEGDSALLRIGDIVVEVCATDPALRLSFDGPVRQFLIGRGEADVRVTVAWRNLPVTIDGDKLFESGSLWQLHRTNGAYRYRFLSESVGSLPYKLAYFDSEFATGQVYLNPRYFDPALPVYPLEYPLDELLILNLLANRRGVEVHACGMVDPQGRGHLFLGQSGGGKTTTANLWRTVPGTHILSDDRIIIRESAG